MNVQNPWLRRFALLTAASTLVLILAGGFVTTTATGDSISEWPFLWGRLQPGFPVEWTHRVVAMIVGLLVAGLALWTHLAEPRKWVRAWAWVALAGVCVQALIGGLRIYVPQAAVAIVHACFAQAVFCAVAAVAAFASTFRPDPALASTRHLGVAAVAAAFLQLVAGAVTRHTGWGIVVHLIGAAVVLFVVWRFASQVAATSSQKGAFLLMGLLGLQLVFGLVAWGIRSSGFVRSHEAPLAPMTVITVHVAIGAFVLASSFVLTLKSFRAAREAMA
ncbi:MAG: COX15/CtaA family protein [Planctomycetes bacterium]|nr:COX15/CtaA family protein [Planctomycetota bacterium]